MGMTSERNDSQWDRYCALAETDARTTDRFQNAGTYANTVETPDMTDEQWAEAFWNGWHANA
jgi:hypothetical protein